MNYRYYLAIIGIVILVIGCGVDQEMSPQRLFAPVSPMSSKIDFENTLNVNDSMNFFKYGYFYMGGGVSAGDLNGDGLSDLFFTGNMVPNRAYLNKGNLQFEEITDQAGLLSSGRWHTGCNFHDFNNDGKLDIYVAVSGIWAERSNLLYLNQGNDSNGIPQFKESGQELGLNDSGYSIQSTYLDYDNDGDLDVYVVNYPPTEFNTKVREYEALSQGVTLQESDHLYRNNGDLTYTDVTEEAGLLRFGLGIGVVSADVNQDGYPDLYVSNDFQTPDFFYLNNGDGTFTESLRSSFQHTSFYGMGVDIADLNNDTLLDLYQVDMTTTDNYRSKANMSSMNIPAFWAGVEAGFGYQYMYNSLQINNGLNPAGSPFFSEIAMSNQMHATEWSWACLLGDYDQDGRRDVFVSNGTRREINNKDYFKWLKQTDTKLKVKYKELSFVDLTEQLPSVKTDNYIFRNNGETFARANEDWGIHYSGYSNGATHADLDNDGDLEIIINNIDSTAVIFQNFASDQNKNFLKVKLKGSATNINGLGARLTLTSGEQTWYADHTLVRGYQSSVEPIIYFGVDTLAVIDKLQVRWTDGKRQTLTQVNANQTLLLDYTNAIDGVDLPQAASQYLRLDQSPSLTYTHRENDYDDYKREVLIPHKMSSLGPRLAVADLNGDGDTDLIIPGPQRQATELHLSNGQGGYRITPLSDAEQEDVFAEIADIDHDGKLDLLISSGGNEDDDLQSSYYSQRYYSDLLTASESKPLSPELRLSAAITTAQDLDGDGISEVFVLGRQVPGRYPSPPRSYVLRDGVDVTSDLAPELSQIGMVTDAQWVDIEGDGDQDLMLCGEWMGIHLFENIDGTLQHQSQLDLSQQIGWWKSIHAADYDRDGDMDFIVGNLGTNYKYQASDEETFDIYSQDFDQDQDQDIVLSYYQEGKQYPVRGRQCSSEQMPSLMQKYPNYHGFASSTVQDIYGQDVLSEGIHLKVNTFQHAYIENLGGGNLKMSTLPPQYQRYSINSIASHDINGDGNLDIIMVGNIFDSEVETPRSDAGYGLLGLGRGDGTFDLVPNSQSGLYVPYEAQDVKIITQSGIHKLVIASNDAPLQVYQITE